MNNERDIEQLNKWRLMLGKYSSDQISFGQGSARYMEMEDVLDYLYSREYGEDSGVREEKGSLEDSNPTVSHWINKVRKLFPKETVEILEKQALDRYGMTELLTDREVLAKMEPNQELLKMILQLKGSMNRSVLEEAERIVKAVVKELMEKLEQRIKIGITGKLNRNSESVIKSSRNLDIKKTIAKNLKNYDKDREKLILDRVYFNSRVRKYNNWRIVIAVDESGSMLDSVIHSAVTAGIFAKLPMLDTRLVIFDTNVVDLSDHLDNPVETLISVQLGGGTNIGQAVRYCEGLIDNPDKTIFVLITDLYEGGSLNELYATSRNIIESGAKMIVLTALDVNANPNYNRTVAARLVDLGAHVAAMTPEQLADWVGGVIS
ncbi:MAG: VWA domain-containing protein [Lachnospiraceae bacterium]|nr:VWA domain-containing protein [Lachnospiraceae bacterium]